MSQRRSPIATVSANSTSADAARQFAVDAARLASDYALADAVVLDVRNISPVTDYFVLATGTSARQMRSVMTKIEELGEPRDFIPLGRNGDEGESTWLLTDFVDVVVHLFTPDGRSYYDLDGLWGDAERVSWAPNSRTSRASTTTA